ncbi:MAG: PAS domain S-box protein [Crocinitomicaceae bacterium]|nr:PAS domain S-box protein [Crocinitomicaceae bacterium]
MSQKQIDIISELLLQYSAGNYSYQGDISDHVNEFDMIISGINMLGEELEASNVSIEYFSSIFNSVTDLVLITDETGMLLDMNLSAEQSLDLLRSQLHKIHFDTLLKDSGIFDNITQELSLNQKIISIEAILSGKEQEIYGQIFCTKILDRKKNFNGYLISIKDITQEKENEKIILKTIFTAQQNEQKRVADNLHDSLGQELSMTKLMISNLRNYAGQDEKCLDLISTCEEMLDTSIQNLRTICYNLMPSVLIRGGLTNAMSDMVDKLEKQDQFEVNFRCDPKLDRMNSDLEIVIYRIVQEFISNMIKHSSATELTIELNINDNNNTIELLLSENGQGFDIKKLNRLGENRGYENLKSKTKAFNGTLNISSEIGMGTTVKVKFPIIPFDEKN